MQEQGSSKPRGPGRPFSTSTRLGKVLVAKGYTRIYVLAGEVEIPQRILSDYLAGRRVLSGDHLMRLSEKLEIPANELLG